MKRKEIQLMVGPPGTGKSTHVAEAMKTLEAEGRTTKVISRDAVRRELTGSATGKKYFAKEKQVFRTFVNMIQTAISEDVEVIFIDATHINEASRHKILSHLTNVEDYILVVKTFRIPKEIAIERNNKREGFAHVPLAAMERMFNDFTFPTMSEFEVYKFAGIHLVNFYE